MSLKAQLEAIIYATETPISAEQMIHLVRESVIAEGAADDAEVKSRVRASLEELVADYGAADH
jgi:chromosome segregation and condensation protein ScpB